MKRLISILLCCLFTFFLIGCGSPKLEDKQEKSNYANMKNGTFNAKFTSLDKAMVNTFYNDEKYPKSKAMKVYEKGSGGWFNIIVLDNN